MNLAMKIKLMFERSPFPTLKLSNALNELFQLLRHDERVGDIFNRLESVFENYLFCLDMSIYKSLLECIISECVTQDVLTGLIFLNLYA